MTARSTLATRLSAAPRLVDPRRARRSVAEFLKSCQNDLAADPIAAALPVLLGEPRVAALLAALAEHSPYLWRLATADAGRLAGLLDEEPARSLQAILTAAGGGALTGAPEAEVMRRLRLGKQALALLVALCDLGGVWALSDVTAALTAYADAAVSAALRHLLAEAVASGKMRAVDPSDPALGCGLVVLALGKHGGGELNYSSDIDIMVFFDPETAPLAGGVEPTPFFVRMVKGLVRLLQERTPDGYVFRTDLRLRPDPASTPTAIALPSAFAYYETVGQNWERAALIKARAVAGDIPIGEAFLAELSPFIWRKYFDFAAIADIHAMKRQIHAVRGHETITVAGHDIKLGRGGIREVEFFVQTQQLVFGGRRPALRGRRTLDMLAALRTENWISAEAEHDLAAAYTFLRGVEHRLQMQADEQTQRLPDEPEALERFARFCGYSSLDRFSRALVDHARRVETHYARLFEEGADLAAGEGDLVFTGTTDDPATLETLSRMGFSDPPGVAETVRGWHFGRRQAVTSPRAREVLTELVPPLLEAFAGSADPDGALAAFDRALARMPAAVELFSILKSHRPVLALFADILGSAPRLADIVAQRPHLLDAIIDPTFLAPPLDPDAVAARMSAQVGAPEQLEDFLDRLRESGQHEIFLVGARILSGTLSYELAGRAYASVAEGVIRLALAEVRRRFALDHGEVPGGRMAVLGMGRLGSREMTATSDLDLVVLYDFDETAGDSDGPRPLNPVVYYGRLTQRLISALTVPTRRGVLYAVDMRLRPSGNKGPAATQFKGFVAYQAEGAETWEHMALTRARVVAGDATLADEIRSAIAAVLAGAADPPAIRADALAMRRLLAQEKGEDEAWDLKLAAGGLVDIEFIAQMLVLVHARAYPELRVAGTEAVLTAARDSGILPVQDADLLITAHRKLSDLFQWQRLCLPGRFDPTSASPGLRRRAAAVLGLPDLKVLERDLSDTQSAVREVFERLMNA
jgi:[glutamine synthetase] adenylyltransferase / [glutamine synthetase]-adenylyl-L-tyrosine phosphorylase